MSADHKDEFNKNGAFSKKRSANSKRNVSKIPAPPGGHKERADNPIDEKLFESLDVEINGAENELSDVFELSDSQILIIDETTKQVSPDLTVWSALRESYIGELEHFGAPDRRKEARLLFELGRIEEEVFRDSAAAVARYKKAAEIDDVPWWILSALRRRYVLAGSFRKVIDTLKRQLKGASEETKRARLLERCGRVAAQAIRDHKSADKYLNKALDLDEAYQTALMTRIELFKTTKDKRREADAWQSAANATRDPDFKACLLAESGFVQLHELRDNARGSELFLLTLKANPHHEGARLSLERQLFLDKRWAELVDLIVQEADLAPQQTINFCNRYLAGNLAASRLGDKDRSIELLEQASILEPDSLLPLWDLLEIYKETGQWERAYSALQRILHLSRQAGPPRLSASLLFRMGNICQIRLNDRERGKQHYREALEVFPADVPARRALAAELQQEHNWQALCDLLQIEAEIHEDPRRRAAVILQQAEITEHELSNPSAAIELYDLAHQLQGGRSPAFRALDRLYTAREDWDKLYEVLDREEKNCEDKTRRVVILKKKARLLEERLNRLDDAVNVAEQLRNMVPQDRQILMDLSRLYERLERWSDLVDNLEKEATLTTEKAEKCSLLCQAGSVLQDRLDDDAGALMRYEEVLKIDEGYLEALSCLGRLHHRKGRWEQLVEVYRKEQRTAQTASDSADLLFRIAQIMETKLADVRGAVKTYAEALDQDATHIPAQDALGDLLRRSSRWEDFLKLLERQTSHTDPVRVSAANLKAGLILQDRLGKLDEAEKRFKEAGKTDIVAPIAHMALERLYAVKEDWKQLAGHLSKVEEGLGWMDPVRAGLRVAAIARHYLGDKARARRWCSNVLERDEHNTEAWINLVELARKSGGAARQAEAIQKLAEVLSDPRSSVALLKQKAAWEGIKEDPEGPQPEAMVAGKILKFAPGDAEALETLERVAVDGANDPALSEVCRQQLNQSGHDPEAAAVIYVRLGDLMWRLGRIEETAESYTKAIEINPQDLPAVRSLRVLHQLRDEQQQVADLLFKEADLCADRQAATAAMMKAGDIWLIEFLDPTKAETAYAKVFENDPTHTVAFQRLCSLVASREGYEELASLYQQRLEKADRTQRPRLLAELAAVYRDNLKQTSGAITVLEELLSLEPNNEEALKVLAELYGEKNRWREASENLEKLVRLSKDEGNKNNWRLKLVEVFKDHLYEDEKAIGVADQVLSVEPDNRTAQQYAVELDLRLGRWKHAAETLNKLADTAQPGQRAMHLIELAKVCERGLNDPNKAQEHLIRAAALCLLAPGAIGELEKFFQQRDDPNGYENLLARVLQEAGADRPGTIPLRLSRARNLAIKLQNPDRAEQEVQAALNQDADSVSARLELASLHLMGDRAGMARTEYEEALKRDPFLHDAYRGLMEVFNKLGLPDRARCSAQALVVLGHATEKEQNAATQAAHALEAAPVVLGILNADHIAQFMSPEQEPPAARNLLQVVAPYLHHVFPQDLVSRNIRNVEQLPATHPRTEIAGHAARRLGIEKYQILVDQSTPQRLLLVPGPKPALVIGKALVSAADPRVFVFFVARTLSMMSTGSAYLQWVELKELEKLLAGVVCQYDRGYGEHIAPQAELADLGKSFVKQIPRRVRKTLDEPALLFSQAGAVGMSAWKEAALRCANRVGLCCCGHLAAAVSGLHSLSQDETEVADLLRYNISPRYAEVRKLCGVSF